MKKMRVLAFILSLLMVAVLFAGCGKSEPTESTTTPTSTTTTPETTTTTTTEEKIDLNDYVFTWCEGISGAYGVYYDTANNAAQQGIIDACDALEAEYNFTFTNVDPSEDLTELILTTSFANESLGDFINANQQRWGEAALSGYLRPLNTDEVRATGMDVLDPNQFDAYMSKAATIGGDVYGVQISGEFVPAQTGITWTFNYGLVSAAGYTPDSLYQAVRDNVWTWDVFMDVVHAGSVYDAETDTYTVCGLSKTYPHSYLDSFGPIIAYKDGKYVSNLESIAVIAGLNTIATVMGDPELIFSLPGGQNVGNSAGRKSFYDGIAMFGMFDKLDDPNSNCNFDYGILPTPRGPAMDTYVSSMFQCKVYFTQLSNQNWQTSCFILGELANLLNDPTKSCDIYHDKVRNDESFEMLRDYIVPNTTCTMVFYSASLITAFESIAADFKSGMSMINIAEKHSAEFESAVANAFKLFNR